MSAQRILVQETAELMVYFETTLNYSFTRQQFFKLIYKILELKAMFIPECISCMATFDLIEAHLRECLASLLVRLRQPLQSQEQLQKAEDLLNSYKITETKYSIKEVEMSTNDDPLEEYFERKQKEEEENSQEKHDLQYDNDNQISLLNPKQAAAPLVVSEQQEDSCENYQQRKKSSFDCSSTTSHQHNSSLCTTESSIGIAETVDERQGEENQKDIQNINTQQMICQDCQWVRRQINYRFCRVLVNLRIAANLRELGCIQENLLLLKNIYINLRDLFEGIQQTHLEILLFQEYGLVYSLISEDELAEKCFLKCLSLVRSLQRSLSRKQSEQCYFQVSAKNMEDQIREQLAEVLFRKGELLNAEKLITSVIKSKLKRFEQISSNPADVLEEVKSLMDVQASNEDIKGINRCECVLLACRIQLKRIRMQKDDDFQNNEAQLLECIINQQKSIEELKIYCGYTSYLVLAAEVNSLGKTLQNLKFYEQALIVFSHALAGMSSNSCWNQLQNNLFKQNLEIALNSAAQCAQKLMRFKQAHDLYQKLLQITLMPQPDTTVFDPTQDKDIQRFDVYSPESVTKEQEIIKLIQQTTTED